MNTPHSSFPDLTLARLSITKGHSLPHWEASGAIYAVALHLADSVPQHLIALWNEERERIRARLCDSVNPPSDDERKLLLAERSALYNDNIEKYLSAGYGESLLSDLRAARAVEETLLYGNGTRYALHAYCIMPNHLHVIVGGFADEGDMKRTVETWKRVSGHRINAALDRVGDVWRRDAYTRIIRNQEEYHHQLSYVWNNPDVAGLTNGFTRQRFVEW